MGTQREGVFPGGIKGSVCGFVNVFGTVWFRVEARTLYQTPLTAFFVLAPPRNPTASGRPIATTGFLGTSRRNPGRLGDMSES